MVNMTKRIHTSKHAVCARTEFMHTAHSVMRVVILDQMTSLTHSNRVYGLHLTGF